MNAVFASLAVSLKCCRWWLIIVMTLTISGDMACVAELLPGWSCRFSRMFPGVLLSVICRTWPTSLLNCKQFLQTSHLKITMEIFGALLWPSMRRNVCFMFITCFLWPLTWIEFPHHSSWCFMLQQIYVLTETQVFVWVVVAADHSSAHFAALVTAVW